MLNLHSIKNRRREPERDGKVLSDHEQDGNVAVGGIGNPARLGPWTVSETERKQKLHAYCTSNFRVSTKRSITLLVLCARLSLRVCTAAFNVSNLSIFNLFCFAVKMTASRI